jgi:hypothetical protein
MMTMRDIASDILIHGNYDGPSNWKIKRRSVPPKEGFGRSEFFTEVAITLS